jgi:hypothetical protein
MHPVMSTFIQALKPQAVSLDLSLTRPPFSTPSTGSPYPEPTMPCGR